MCLDRQMEITFEQYDIFAISTGRRLTDDKGWGRKNRPVINVDWEDAAAYARWLTEVTGNRCTMPSEAQWEYACRAGTETPVYSGSLKIEGEYNATALDAIAWYGGNSSVGYRGRGWDTKSLEISRITI